MEIASPGLQGSNGSIPAQVTGNIDPDLVVDHLVNLLEITLGASSSDLESHGSLLSDAKRADTVQRCQRFATESQTVLYVQKDLIATDKANGVNGHSSELRSLL